MMLSLLSLLHGISKEYLSIHPYLSLAASKIQTLEEDGRLGNVFIYLWVYALGLEWSQTGWMDGYTHRLLCALGLEGRVGWIGWNGKQ